MGIHGRSTALIVRRSDRTSRRGLVRLALATGLLALLAPAGAFAAVNEPPAAPRILTLFPERDFVSGEGFTPGASVTYQVIRNGTVIGTSEAVTADGAGLAEVNHPGGGCWVTTTPDILPGDKVRAAVAGAPDQDQSTVANVTAERPTNPSAGTIVVRGTARNAAGQPLPLAELEQRLVASSADPFDKSGKRTLRAPGEGTIAYDAAGSPNWTARYTGLTAHDVALAMGVESRGMWTGPGGTGLTIYETPGAPGPGAPCTAPLATNAVTASDHAYDGRNVVNSRNAGANLLLSGVAQADASQVRVTVTDAANRSTGTVTALLSTGPGGKTWSAALPAGDVAGLADGTLTAAATYTIPGGTVTGATLAITKDTVLPGAPAATPPAGTYDAAPSVFLTSSDAAASILYTLDGSAPGTAPSPTTTRYGGAFAVTRTLTVKALALDPNGNSSAVASHAYALVPRVSLSPGGTIDYGNQAVGTASDGVPVTLTNTGAADLTVGAVAFTGTHAADFSRTISTCTPGTTLSPGQSCSVQNVRFTPAAAGARTAALTFTTDAPGSPHGVPLTGSGTAAPAPAATASPDSLAFGSQETGTASAPKTVTVTNTGTAPLRPGTATVTGDFGVTADGCAGRTVAVGGSCSIDVRFAPQTDGARSGTLGVPSDAAGAPSTVSLSGTGTPPAVPVATVTPASVAFGDQITGTTSAARTVTVRNTGGAPLHIGATAVSGADFPKGADTCQNTSVAPGASCTIAVAFAPVSAGTKTATLTIPDNAAGTPHTVSLGGTGATAAPAIDVAPAALAFGDQTSGTASAARTVTVRNTGNAPLHIGATAVSGADFPKGADTCQDASVAPGASCTIAVGFAPVSAGTKTGALTIDHDAGAPSSVPLSGNGVTPPAVTLSPATLTFAAQRVGTTSAAQAVTLTNSGATPLAIGAVALAGANPTNYVKGADTCANATVLPAGTCTVSVTFAPGSRGTKLASLVFTDTASPATWSVGITGGGVSPIAALAPATANFGSVRSGTTSAPKRFTVTNSGNAAMTMTAFSITGPNAGQFAISARTCSLTAQLAAPGTCTIDVVFRPTGVLLGSAARSAVLNVASDAPNSPHKSDLIGTAKGSLL